jgi:hypothetical protein
VPAVAPQLDLIALLPAALAAVLAELAALAHHAVAGRMRAFGGVSHSSLLDRLYARLPASASTAKLNGWLR